MVVVLYYHGCANTVRRQEAHTLSVVLQQHVRASGAPEADTSLWYSNHMCVHLVHVKRTPLCGIATTCACVWYTWVAHVRTVEGTVRTRVRTRVRYVPVVDVYVRPHARVLYVRSSVRTMVVLLTLSDSLTPKPARYYSIKPSLNQSPSNKATMGGGL